MRVLGHQHALDAAGLAQHIQRVVQRAPRVWAQHGLVGVAISRSPWSAMPAMVAEMGTPWRLPSSPPNVMCRQAGQWLAAAPWFIEEASAQVPVRAQWLHPPHRYFPRCRRQTILIGEGM